MAFMRGRINRFWLLASSLALPMAHAQVEAVVQAQLDHYSIAALVVHLEGARAFRHGIALFPGHPGILRLRDAAGAPQYELRGNFLIRSRRHWLDDETLVAVLDAPSDQWATFTQDFRATARYGADVARLLEEIGRRYAVAEWTFVGTSEGSVSAFHAARMNAALARRLILTASVWGPGGYGPGLSSARFEALAAPLLWVHHERDPCGATQYREAARYAQKSMSPLLTVRGGGPERGPVCMAFSHHGFVGQEPEVVQAMRTWVKTGRLPP